MDNGVSGAIARVEPTPAHQEFLQSVEPDWAEIKLHHAGQLVKQGHTASSWATDNVNMIVTSAINDERLDSISWVEERDIVKEFAPEAHIPTDVSVYFSQDTDDRVECIQNCMEGTAFMKGELASDDISIIPLFKGYTKSEREICLSAFEALNTDLVAIYVARYFSAKGGNNLGEMLRYLQACDKHSMPNVILLGLLSPTYLEQVPEWVVAGSGQNQWRKRITPSKQSVSEMKSAYAELSNSVDEALGFRESDPAEERAEQPLTEFVENKATGD